MKQESEQFKVEATPVIDLKKSSVSDMWDNEKTEVYLEDEAGGTAFLLTSEGDYIPISAFPFVIGRGNECDLVLNKKGMSRKHAEIVFQSGRFVVNDLDSLNGLKVNGYKVARVILEEGDSIKLGEVTLIFTSSKGGSEAKAAAAESTPSANPFGTSAKASSGSLKKVLYGTAALSLIVIAGAGVYSMMGNSLSSASGQRIVSVPNPTTTSQTQERAEEQAVVASAQSAEAASAAPDAAVASSTDVVLDPTAPPPSIALAPSAKGPSAPPPPAEDSLPPPVAPKAPQRSEPVKAPAVAKVAQPAKPAPKVVQPAKPVTTPTVSSVAPMASSTGSLDARYLSGDVDALLREMGQAVKTSKAGDTAYRNKYSALSSMYSKYTAGKQAYMEGRQAEAFSLWSSFVSEEKAMFGSKRSAMASASISKMADGYAALGNEAAKAGKNHDAYKYWQKSISYGDSVAARIALDAANQKSKQLYRQALRLEYVNTERAKELWKQVMDTVPPGTEYYTKASSKLAWYDKWGA